MTSPVGLQLVDGKPYVVGPLIGSGAFGLVYSVEIRNSYHESYETSEKGRWVAKVVPKPKKTTKKRNSPSEIAYNMLYKEFLLYTAQFTDLCGTIIPNVPRKHSNDGLESYRDDRQGFRCLVMERMECTLFDGLPKYMQSVKTSEKFDVAGIAIKLIKICEAIHSKNHLIVDVKPENIMICRHSSRKTSCNNISNYIADSIRLIDFGLVQQMGLTGHRPNEGIQAVCGTALYASLNVHNHETPSRRDDIEAMLYVIGELVIRANAIMIGNTSQYEKGEFPTYLPWANGTSDDDVGRIKRQNVSNSNSAYYQRMPINVAIKLKDCWSEVRSLQYMSKPDYASICEYFSGLVIASANKKKTDTITYKQADSIASKKTDTVTRSAPKQTPEKSITRMTRSSSNAPVTTKESGNKTSSHTHHHDAFDREDTSHYAHEPPPKYRRLPIRPYSHPVDPTCDSYNLTSDVEMEDAQQVDHSFQTESTIDGDEDDSFVTTMQYESEMNVDKKRPYNMTSHGSENCDNGNNITTNSGDVRYEVAKSSTRSRPPNTNKYPVTDSTKKGNSPSPVRKMPSNMSNNGIIVRVNEYGDYLLDENKCVTYTVTSDSTNTKRGGTFLKLPKHCGIETNHAQLDLITTKDAVHMVKVTNLLSSKSNTKDNMILIDDRIVEPRKNMMAFMSSRIQIGKVHIRLVRSTS